MNLEELKSMELHQAKAVIDAGSKGRIAVMRVPGGWVYEFSGGDQFDHEFVPEPPQNPETAILKNVIKSLKERAVATEFESFSKEERVKFMDGIIGTLERLT